MSRTRNAKTGRSLEVISSSRRFSETLRLSQQEEGTMEFQFTKDLFIVPQKWPVQITVHDSVRTIFLLLCGKKKSGQCERVLDPFFEPIQIGHMSLSLSLTVSRWVWHSFSLFACNKPPRVVSHNAANVHLHVFVSHSC